MDEQINLNPSIEELNQQEMLRLAGAREQFIGQGNAIPERRMVNFGDVITRFGIEVILRIVATLGAALVSATAVGAIMQLTDERLRGSFAAETDSVGTGIFWWSMFAFEGTLMAAGLGKGRKNKDIKDSLSPVIAGGLVTIIGGLLRSLTLTGNTDFENFAAWIFAVVVAVAGPVVSFYGAENVGFILQEIQALQTGFDLEWQEKLSEWEGKFERFYARFAKQVHNVDRRRKPKFEDEQVPQHPQAEENLGNLRENLRLWMQAEGIKPWDVGKGGSITPAQIAVRMGIFSRKGKDAIRTYSNQFKQEPAEMWE